MENNVSGVPLRKSCALYVVMLAVWTVLTVLLWRQYVPVIISPQFTGGAGTAARVAASPIWPWPGRPTSRHCRRRLKALALGLPKSLPDHVRNA